VRTGKPERAFEQSNLLTGQTLAKRSMQTVSEGTTHALRTIPIFAARMSQKMRDACAIVFLVHTCKRTRTVCPKGVKYQIYRCIIFSKISTKYIDASSSLKKEGITVVVQNGVVRLTGTVPTGAQRLEAAVVARAIPGVRAVQDDLRLATAPN
jgi:osmotically-inducible protein OsmY